MIHSMLRLRGVITVGLVCGGFLGATSVALAMSSASSGVVQTPEIYGHTYDSVSEIYVGWPTTPADFAETDVYTAGGATVPSGYMSANARKFKNGSLCEQSGFEYNNEARQTWSVYAESKACGSGVYYSYGEFQAWNGSGYNTYYSGQSPSLNG